MGIKNIIFDIGNVLVRWDPLSIVSRVFPQERSQLELTSKIFKSQIWYDLNLGKLTEKQAIDLYSKNLKISKDKLHELMQATKESLVPLEDSIILLNELYMLKFPLYCITDNIKELVDYLKNKYDFLNKFSGIAVSADLGVLKPDPKIYKYLSDLYSLIPYETVFIDDILSNVQGAIDLGWQGILFTNAQDCRLQLQNIGVQLL